MTKQYDDAEMEKAKQDFWRDIQKSIKELNNQVEKSKERTTDGKPNGND